MDISPIYCAEQIVVPHDLVDILKAYTKEVIRRQPANILEFSANYFSNLANVANNTKEIVPPSREQLKFIRSRIGGDEKVTADIISGVSQQAGLSKATISKALLGGKFDSSKVEVDKYLFLLLAMSCDSFSTAMNGIFAVFGGGSEIPVKKLIQLLGYLSAMDRNITPQLLDDLGQALEGNDIVTYHDAATHSLLMPMMRSMQETS